MTGRIQSVIAALVVLMWANATTLSQAADADTPRTAALPIEAELVLDTDKVPLPDDQRGADYRKTIREGAGRGEASTPPLLPGKLVLTNTGKKPVTINRGGDATYIEIKLEGPGAVSVRPAMMMTMEFRLGEDVTIKPGGKLELPIGRLQAGTRGLGTWHYWTEPGRYTVQVSYRTPMSFGDTTLESAVIVAAPKQVQVGEGQANQSDAVVKDGLEFRVHPQHVELAHGKLPSFGITVTNPGSEAGTVDVVKAGDRKVLGHRIASLRVTSTATDTVWLLSPGPDVEAMETQPLKIEPGESVYLALEPIAEGREFQMLTVKDKKPTPLPAGAYEAKITLEGGLELAPVKFTVLEEPRKDKRGALSPGGESPPQYFRASRPAGCTLAGLRGGGCLGIGRLCCLGAGVRIT